MHYCGFSEHAALFRVPYARGLQYIHAALLSQGAHCIRPGDTARDFDAAISKARKLVTSAPQYE
jgi:hypothetical protein